MASELKSALDEFVRFAQTLHGEKSGAQTFLDHFFRALDHKGVIEAGATFEFCVAKKPGSPQLELITGNGAPSRAKGGKKNRRSTLARPRAYRDEIAGRKSGEALRPNL